MSEGKGCWKVGCFGCAAMVLIPFGLVIVMAGLQLAQRDREPDQQRVETEHRLPSREWAERLPAGEAEGSLTTDEISSGLAIVGTGAGTIDLDFSMGELRVVPGPLGSAIRVEGQYDRNKFVLEEVFQEGDGGDWTYSLTFDSKGGMLGMMARGGVVEGDNRITLFIPRGYEFRLVGELGLGSAELDLGGLAIVDIDLEIGLGDHEIGFREPTALPVEQIVLDSSLGALELREIGNASPRVVDIRHSVGDLVVDLDGAWQRDAEMKVHLGLGGTRIMGPREARLEIDGSPGRMVEVRNDYESGRVLDDDAPTVRLSVSGSIGELRID